MPEIRPFKAIRYHAKYAAQMGDIICPPYDIISRSLQKKLLKKNPFNIVRLELPSPSGDKNQYQHAFSTFKQWIDRNILMQDGQESFYVYEQHFAIASQRFCRRGFFAAVKISTPQKGLIKPHEKTLPKPKEDRLNLLKAVRANISPIFAFFSDAHGRIRLLLSRETRKKPLVDVEDDEKIRHRLYTVDNPEEIYAMQKIVRNKNVFIADGHHRYETAWNYLHYANRNSIINSSVSYVLMFLCPIEDKGLVVLPTHRVVTQNSQVNWDLIKTRARKYYSFKYLKSPVIVCSYMKRKKQQHVIGVCTKEENILLIQKNLSAIMSSIKGKSRAFRQLDVVQLHTLLLKDIDAQHIRYIKNNVEACAAARTEDAVTFLMNAPTIDDIRRISMAGETMPQKTTYFYPKLATGLVIYKL